MIVVKVELHSVVTGRVTEIARMNIANDGKSNSANVGSYDAATLRGRDTRALDRGTPQRHAHVENYPRQAIHVWNLVQACLTLMGYGHAKSVDPNRMPPIHTYMHD
jgi:hypothetical protein